MWSYRTFAGFVGADGTSAAAIASHPQGHRLVRTTDAAPNQGAPATSSAGSSAAHAAPVPPGASQADVEIETLSLEQLRLLIGIAGLTTDDCSDEAELRARAREAITSYVKSLSGTKASSCSEPVPPAVVGEPVAVCTPITSPVPATTLADEIQKLASLRDAGVLTEEEFKAAKAMALGIAT